MQLSKKHINREVIFAILFAIWLIIMLAALSGCTYLHVDPTTKAITRIVVFSDSTVEGLSVKFPDGTEASLSKSAQAAKTELLTEIVKRIP